MRKFIGPLLLVFLGVTLCHAQHPIEKLMYQLAESILKDLPPRFAYAKRSSDGRYHRLPPMATDTPIVRPLLLDHPYFTGADFEFVLAGEGTPKRAEALKYFSPADVVYMRQQLPASRGFRFEQIKIREPWVTVIPLDTVLAINKRLGWRADFWGSDSLLQRYGTDMTFAIWGVLFSKNHKRALVNMTSEGWETCVYVKVGTAWRKEATLYEVID